MKTISIAVMLLCNATTLRAQDRRPSVEPRFPPTCLVLTAPLQSDAAGPQAGGTPASEDAESSFQAAQLTQALARCPEHQAVELALGPTPAYNAFLLDPVVIPSGVSLIVDAGVTVYASRNPAHFQNSAEKTFKCGTVQPGIPIDGVCLSLLTLANRSGIYGFGILDGQGHRPLIRDGAFAAGTWWDLLDEKKSAPGCAPGIASSDNSACEQASPPVITAGELSGTQVANDLTLYHITIRNPPFHTVRLGGKGITVWDVNVQAPWNVPNSDGFDVRGQDILFHGNTVANGDQDIAITSVSGQLTSHMTIEGLTAYGKGGVALLGGAAGITDLLVRDMAMTGDVPSFQVIREHGSSQITATVINGVDVMSARLRGTDQKLASYGQALPTATHDLQGLQINSNINANSDASLVFKNIVFQDICLKDVVQPIHLGPLVPFTTQNPAPLVEHVVFRDVHVLSPTEQYPQMANGVVQSDRSGTYKAVFESFPPNGQFNQIAFQNVVFDDVSQGETSLATLQAIGNRLTTRENVYPATLNEWVDPKTPLPSGWTLQDNSYGEQTSTSRLDLAHSCPSERWPFIIGSLFLSRPGRSFGSATNLEELALAQGESVVLNATIQPAMSQTTWFRADSYGAKPGLLAVGAPPLANVVEFYEGDHLLGMARPGANGTLASITIMPRTAGLHVYTARYPGDVYYNPMAFGTVRVFTPPAD